LKKIGIIILLITGFTKVQAGCATGIFTTPIIDSITVDIPGNVTLCWQAVADPDVIKYKILKIDPFTGAYIDVDSVLAPINCYTIPAVSNNSDNESIGLTVISVYSCTDPISGLVEEFPSNVGVFHYTIHLTKNPDPCTSSILLEWTPYDDFTSGPAVLYDVYVSTSGIGGPYTIVGTTSTTNYNYTGVIQGVVYDFFVRAIENNGAGPYTSSSNDVNYDAIDFFKEPNPTYLYTATVSDSQEIIMQFYVDTAADISHYNIKRAASLNGTYSTIGSVSAFSGMNPLQQYTDNDAVDANNNFYFYNVEAINTCGDSRDTSNIGRTILLKVKSDGIIGTNTLTITQYDGWAGNVSKYDVYRSVAGVWEFSSVGTISTFSDSTVYVDNISTILEGNGEFCYYIKATEGVAIHPYGSPSATSLSNEACALHEPLIYVPNAFAPFGNYNIEFKPILTYAEPSSYLFQIYNKWGQKIFETKDVTQAWNGRVNNTGNMCKVDSYVYLVIFDSASGEEFSKRGVVTLVN
jgi:hypothetical protein